MVSRGTGAGVWCASRCRDACAGTSICAGEWDFGAWAGSGRMGRRRKRRTPGWDAGCDADAGIADCAKVVRRTLGAFPPGGRCRWGSILFGALARLTLGRG